MHEPLVSKALFNEAQDVLDGRKRNKGIPVFVQDQLALRGFLKCSKCTRLLTGSASKGRSSYYHYYHCSSACSYRQKAEHINDIFVSYLDEFTLAPGIAELFKEVILNVYAENIAHNKNNRRNYSDQIDLLNNRLSKARELLLNGDIDSKDYKVIKTEAEQKIISLESKLVDLNNNNFKINEVASIVEKAVEKLTKLNLIYCNSGSEEKRALIGSIFSEKFTFEDLEHRTASISDSYNVITAQAEFLWGNKKSICFALAINTWILEQRLRNPCPVDSAGRPIRLF